jgi:uncharacterized protein YdaU (DUF1376 family)
MMHYFQFEIKEWISNTAHLSLEEESAYLRLIFYYYDSEKPIPSKDVGKIFKRCRIPEDLGFYILDEFFTFTNEETWIHNRCNKEIERFKAKSESAKKSAKIRWDEQKDANALPMQSKGNANHKPLTINQEPLTINQDKNIIVNNRVDSPVNCPHEEVISLYHFMLPTLRRVEIWNETRKGYLKARWREAFATFNLKTKEEGLEYFEEVFGIVKESAFLLGKTNNKDGKAFQADLEWILRPTNFAKIVERKYSK